MEGEIKIQKLSNISDAGVRVDGGTPVWIKELKKVGSLIKE